MMTTHSIELAHPLVSGTSEPLLSALPPAMPLPSPEAVVRFGRAVENPVVSLDALKEAILANAELGASLETTVGSQPAILGAAETCVADGVQAEPGRVVETTVASAPSQVMTREPIADEPAIVRGPAVGEPAIVRGPVVGEPMVVERAAAGAAETRPADGVRAEPARVVEATSTSVPTPVMTREPIAGEPVIARGPVAGEPVVVAGAVAGAAETRVADGVRAEPARIVEAPSTPVSASAPIVRAAATDVPETHERVVAATPSRKPLAPAPTAEQVAAAGVPIQPPVLPAEAVSSPQAAVAPVTVEAVQAAVRSVLPTPTETFVQAAEAVADTILVSPGLLRGQGEVQVRLRPDVLDGSTVRISVTGRQMEVQFIPSTPEIAVLIENSRPQLEQHLAERIHVFQIAVGVTGRKTRQTERT